MLYGDERDMIIAKWNQLQASWGTGKGYFSPNAPPVEFTPENPFCCFKVMLFILKFHFCLFDLSMYTYLFRFKKSNTNNIDFLNYFDLAKQ